MNTNITPSDAPPPESAHDWDGWLNMPYPEFRADQPPAVDLWFEGLHQQAGPVIHLMWAWGDNIRVATGPTGAFISRCAARQGALGTWDEWRPAAHPSQRDGGMLC